MSEQFANRDLMAEGSELEAIIEETNRPAMESEVAEGRMPDISALDAADGAGGPGPSTSEGAFMAPVESIDAETATDDLPTGEYPDMEPIRSGGGASPSMASAGGDDESYVRLRLAVVGDQLEVVDAWSVDGPLVVEEKLHGDLAYEVRCGDQQLCVGSVADAGELRGFPNPDGPPDQQGHAIVRDPNPEIAVRVPTTHVTVDDLPQVEVLLYRLKGGATDQAMNGGPLTEQMEDRAREVARLSGLDLDVLPNDRAAAVRRAIG